VLSHDDQDKGIYLKTSSDRVAVMVQSAHGPTSDTLLALPTRNMCIEEYAYYGISIPTDIAN